MGLDPGEVLRWHRFLDPDETWKCHTDATLPLSFAGNIEKVEAIVPESELAALKHSQAVLLKGVWRAAWGGHR